MGNTSGIKDITLPEWRKCDWILPHFSELTGIEKENEYVDN